MSVWIDIYGDTGQALVLATKSHILMCIIKVQRKEQLSKKLIADKTGINRSRIKALLKGYFYNFTIEEMLIIAHSIGALNAATPSFELENVQ